MESAFEHLRISVMEEKVNITLQGESESIEFGGMSPVPVESDESPAQFYKLSPSERPEEYVITFEFESPDEHTGPALARLDTNVRNVRLRLHDDGYVLEGEISSWIAYTDAVRSRLS